MRFPSEYDSPLVKDATTTTAKQSFGRQRQGGDGDSSFGDGDGGGNLVGGDSVGGDSVGDDDLVYSPTTTTTINDVSVCFITTIQFRLSFIPSDDRTTIERRYDN